MNKKFSTLMAGLLLAGGMATPVFAESFLDVKAKADAGTYDLSSQYFFVFVDGKSPSTLPTLEDPSSAGFYILKSDGTAVPETEESKMDADCLWKVNPVPHNGKVYYQLVNKKNGTLVVKVGETEKYSDFDPTLDENILAFDINHGFTGSLTSTSSTSWSYNLQPVEANEDVSDGTKLNDLYNSIGFNMLVNGVKEEDQASIKNLFATEGRVLALQVDKVNSPNFEVDGCFYPAGTYFVTNTPAGKKWDDVKDSADSDEIYEFLNGCTFIAVNSTILLDTIVLQR